MTTNSKQTGVNQEGMKNMELNIIKQIKSTLYKIRRASTKPPKEAKPKVVRMVEVKPKRELSVLIDGKQMTLKEIALAYNLEIKTVQARYKVGNRGNLLIRPSQKSYNRA